LWGFNDTVEIGSLMLRAAYLNVQFESSSPRLTNLFLGFAGMTAMSQPAAAQEAIRLQQIYDTAEKQEVELFNVGLSYDANDWFVLSEVNKVKSEGVQVGSWGGYVSGGVRRGAFTPYLTISRAKNENRNETLVPLDGVPPMTPAWFMGMGINGFVTAVTTDIGQTTTALGMRWDFARNFALKAQYDHIDLDKQSIGRFLNVQPDFERGGTVGLFSLAVDYVF